MSFLNFHVVECNECEQRSNAFDAAIYMKWDVWQILHADGWTRHANPFRSGMDYRCPACSKKKYQPKGAAAK
jgi:hypothetical protein